MVSLLQEVMFRFCTLKTCEKTSRCFPGFRQLRGPSIAKSKHELPAKSNLQKYVMDHDPLSNKVHTIDQNAELPTHPTNVASNINQPWRHSTKFLINPGCLHEDRLFKKKIIAGQLSKYLLRFGDLTQPMDPEKKSLNGLFSLLNM